ncbi:MAG: hypothetical protein GY832_18315, partial [Chloroflexi bacterium]|nr:hypothetical protein [Chloroflexota bacterium]
MQVFIEGEQARVTCRMPVTSGALDLRIAIVQLWYDESVISGGECKHPIPPVHVVAFGSAPDVLHV